MKKEIIAAIAATALFASQAWAAGDHTSRHGGIVVETRAADVEIVARPGVIQIYLQDHGKPMTLDGATAKVTLLNGAEKAEVQLVPADGRLEARGSFKVARGTKGIAVVTLPGKGAATARFEMK